MTAVSLLHPEKWRDLAPEFEARKLLLAAEGALSDAVDTAPVAKALKGIRDTLKLLHPVTQDPAGVAEYEARAAGTYEPPGGGTGERRDRHHRGPDPRDKLISDLQARLDKLEAAGTEAAPPTKDEKKKPAEK